MSVKSSGSCSRTQRENASAPIARNFWREPGGGRTASSNRGGSGSGGDRVARRPRDARKAVDRDLGRIGQEPHRSILANRKAEQLGVLVDEPGRAVARQEIGAARAG